MNVPFHASTYRRVKLGEVADFQTCTVAVALWTTQCTDAEKTSSALRTRLRCASAWQAAKRLQKRRSSIGPQFAQVFLRVHRCCATRSGCCHGLLENAIGGAARHEHTGMPAFDQLLR